MSKIKIQGNASGTGVVTLTAPNTNTDRTITLPDGDISLGVGIDDNATSTAITIDASENVGIGTSSPVSLLHVHQVGTANASVIIERATGNTATLTSGASTGFTIDSDNTNGGAPITRFTQNGTEKLRIHAAGGISFNGDTAAANALDDYETGTFTATLTADTAPTTACTTTGHYTKIGNVCHFSIYRFEAVNTTGASGHMKITGLPFTASTATIIPAPWTHAFDFNTAKNQFFSLSGTVLYAYESTSGGAWSEWNITAGTTKYMVVNGTYRAD
jgi:hypothetical protein